MTDNKALLDRQLSRVDWTPRDRRTVLCAIRKEQSIMKKKLVPLLLTALLLAMLTGVAVAATVLWGVEDFAARRGETLPDVPVQRSIPQQGGVGREMIVSVTDALWDGETVRITLHCQPRAKDLLLMEACLDLDMPVRNLDRDLPEGGTIAQWIAASAFTDFLGLDVEPVLADRYPYGVPHSVAWHLEDDGSYTLYYTFEGVSDGSLEVCFRCVTWGWDEERESFCDDARSESVDLFCTLTPPETP